MVYYPFGGGGGLILSFSCLPGRKKERDILTLHFSLFSSIVLRYFSKRARPKTPFAQRGGGDDESGGGGGWCGVGVGPGSYTIPSCRLMKCFLFLPK